MEKEISTMNQDLYFKHLALLRMHYDGLAYKEGDDTPLANHYRGIIEGIRLAETVFKEVSNIPQIDDYPEELMSEIKMTS